VVHLSHQVFGEAEDLFEDFQNVKFIFELCPYSVGTFYLSHFKKKNEFIFKTYFWRVVYFTLGNLDGERLLFSTTSTRSTTSKTHEAQIEINLKLNKFCKSGESIEQLSVLKKV